MWLICFYISPFSPIPSDFRFHTTRWKVHTLQQTADLEVHVSLFTLLRSGFTINSHICSISNSTYNSSIFIKGLTNYFVLFLARNLVFLWTQKFVFLHPQGLESTGHIKRSEFYFTYFKLSDQLPRYFKTELKLFASSELTQPRKFALERFRFPCTTRYLASPAASKTCTSAAIILSLKVDLSFKNQWTNLCTSGRSWEMTLHLRCKLSFTPAPSTNPG